MIEEQEMPVVEKNAYPSIKQGWGIIGILVLVVIAYSFPIGLISLVYEDIGKGPFLLLNYAIPFVVLILITRKWWKSKEENESRLNLKAFPLAIIPVVVIMCLAIISLNVEISSWVPLPDLLKEMFESMLEPSIWGFLTVVVAAPIIEEILMRGIVLNGLLKNYHPWKAILWSAFFFGLMHLNPWQLVTAFIAGVAIGYLYWKTKSLILCILIHAINNGLAYFVSLQFSEVENYAEIFDLNAWERTGIFILALVILYSCYLYFERYFSQKPASEL
ncbi:CPBP family intramembrane glutamic endopeptidase [Marinifilum caeruleilacunae]|nr:type II CAAX endopeptidase family protein [Marinifilum caeruleilacunae]